MDKFFFKYYYAKTKLPSIKNILKIQIFKLRENAINRNTRIAQLSDDIVKQFKDSISKYN